MADNSLFIRESIDANNTRIQELMDNCTFVLNPEIKHLLDENEKLQQKCRHEFVDGVCKYCDTMEVVNGD